MWRHRDGRAAEAEAAAVDKLETQVPAREREVSRAVDRFVAEVEAALARGRHR